MWFQVLHGNGFLRIYYLLNFDVISKRNKPNYLKKTIKIPCPFLSMVFETSVTPIL